jgi:SAM-dependent methyltransferase
MKPSINPLSTLVCPVCHGSLNSLGESATCTSCSKLFPRHPDGFLDLRPSDWRYHDWLSSSEEALSSWFSSAALTEAAGAEFVVESYLIPLVQSLGLDKNSFILSVGCGGAWDVKKFHKMGYIAWGIDNGGRIVAWKNHVNVEFLALGDALCLPYKDNIYDFVFAEGVIEHIGYEGDVKQQKTDVNGPRQLFANQLLRVTKPGGFIMIGCPNRLFPIDFFHGKTFNRFPYRFHSPYESFLLSFMDIKKMFTTETDWVRPLTLKNYFNLPRVIKDSPTLTIPIILADKLFGILPGVFWKSVFNPYIVILIKKSS